MLDDERLLRLIRGEDSGVQVLTTADGVYVKRPDGWEPALTNTPAP